MAVTCIFWYVREGFSFAVCVWIVMVAGEALVDDYDACWYSWLVVD